MRSYRVRLRRKHIVSLLTVLLAVLGTVAQQQGWFDTAGQAAVINQPGLYTVERFVDGDTIAVRMGDTTETIRMIGIDTPETHRPNTPVQCYGPAAAAYTKDRIGSQRIRLVSDSLSTNRDRYDRLLRYVYLTDGTNLNQELVAEGYAFAYLSFPFTKSDDFAAAQSSAQDADKGLWGNCNPRLESNGRWQSNSAE